MIAGCLVWAGHSLVPRQRISPSPQARKRANYIKSANEPGGTRVCDTLDQTVAGDQTSNVAKSQTYW